MDSPANEQEFIVVKRLEDADMADAVSTSEVNKGGESAAVESVPVEVAKATGEAIEKAMIQVSSLVENIVKSTQANKGGGESGGDTETETDVEKRGGPLRKTFKTGLEAAGVKGDALVKALEKFDAEAKKAFDFKPKKDETTTTKATGDGTDGEPGGETQTADTGEEVAPVTKLLETLEVAIHKAKAFTPKREEALKSAISQLNDLLKELSMQKIPTGASPSTTVPGGGAFGASGIMDLTVKKLAELTEQVSKALGEMHTVQKSLGERVESIEKTRNPSSSVESDGGTDANVNKTMWSGVL